MSEQNKHDWSQDPMCVLEALQALNHTEEQLIERIQATQEKRKTLWDRYRAGLPSGKTRRELVLSIHAKDQELVALGLVCSVYQFSLDPKIQNRMPPVDVIPRPVVHDDEMGFDVSDSLYDVDQFRKVYFKVAREILGDDDVVHLRAYMEEGA